MTLSRIAQSGKSTSSAEERTAAERAASSREVDGRDLQRLARIGTWCWNPRTDTAHWSAEMYEIFTFEPGTAPPPYRDAARLFAPESLGRLKESVSRAMRTGEPYELDLEVPHSHGK